MNSFLFSHRFVYLDVENIDNKAGQSNHVGESPVEIDPLIVSKQSGDKLVNNNRDLDLPLEPIEEIEETDFDPGIELPSIEEIEETPNPDDLALTLPIVGEDEMPELPELSQGPVEEIKETPIPEPELPSIEELEETPAPEENANDIPLVDLRTGEEIKVDQGTLKKIDKYLGTDQHPDLALSGDDIPVVPLTLNEEQRQKIDQHFGADEHPNLALSDQ